jgi:hypothetical protein
MADVDGVVNIRGPLRRSGGGVVALGDHSAYSAIMPPNEQSGVVKSSASERIIF